MNQIFADTFYYLALINPDDPAHLPAKETAVRLHVPMLTTAWVLAEVANYFASARQRHYFLLLYERLRVDPDVRVVPPTEALFDEGVAFYTRYRDKDWSLTDCISFLVMKEHGILEALTGDHHFEQAGFRILLK